MQNDNPVLLSRKNMKREFNKFWKINITSKNDFSIGRALHNSVVLPSLTISRNHCKFRKENHNWVIHDCSAYGVEVNGIKVGKGNSKILLNNDVIILDSQQEFMYSFIWSNTHIPQKRIKLNEDQDSNYIDDVKKKFEKSQNIEIQHIENKIHRQKQLQVNDMLLKDQLCEKINIKLNELIKSFDLQIENLKGPKDEVNMNKTLLIQERDAQIENHKNKIDTINTELMKRIIQYGEKESELVLENDALKKKLLKERSDFFKELEKENSSKQDLLNNLEKKIKKQEEMFLKEKEDFLEKERETMRLAKDRELNELVEQSKQRELKLLEEHRKIKQNLEKEIEELKKEKKSVKLQLETIDDPEIGQPVAGSSQHSADKPVDRIGEMMETELQCSICTEIFVSPILLNCGHTFCKFCIDSWKKQQKNCPNCRVPIKHESRSIVVESFLEKILPNLSDEMKKKRDETLKARAEEQRQKARLNGRRKRARDFPITVIEESSRRMWSLGVARGMPFNSRSGTPLAPIFHAIQTVDLTSPMNDRRLSSDVIVIDDESIGSRE